MTTPEVQSSAPPEQPSDRIRAALDALKNSADNLSQTFTGMRVEEVQQVLEQAATERLQLTQQRFDLLKQRVMQHATETLQSAREALPEAEISALLDSLDQRLGALEQFISGQQSAVSGMLGSAWERFRSLPYVGSTLDALGTFFGETVPARGAEFLEWAKSRGKRIFFTVLSTPEFLNAIPVIGPLGASLFQPLTEYARRGLEQENALSGIRQAVQDYRTGRNVPVLFNDAFTTTDWNQFRTVLQPWLAGSTDIAMQTNAYVAKYIDIQRAQPDVRLPIEVTIAALTAAALTPNMPLPVPAAPETQQPAAETLLPGIDIGSTPVEIDIGVDPRPRVSLDLANKLFTLDGTSWRATAPIDLPLVGRVDAAEALVLRAAAWEEGNGLHLRTSVGDALILQTSVRDAAQALQAASETSVTRTLEVRQGTTITPYSVTFTKA